MSSSPPPYANITGTSQIVAKYNFQETILEVDGNARPGQLVVDLETDPPQLYIGNNAGNITLVASVSSTTILGGSSIQVVDNGNNSVTINNVMTETVYNGGNVSGSLTPNRNNGTIQKFTLTGNITLNVPTNMSAGQSLTLILTQDTTGNRLLDANTAYLFASGFQTLSVSSGAIDMLNIFSDGTSYYTTLTVEYS